MLTSSLLFLFPQLVRVVQCGVMCSFQCSNVCTFFIVFNFQILEIQSVPSCKWGLDVLVSRSQVQSNK